MNKIKNSNLPDDFSWRNYIKLNKDLSGYTRNNAIKHYKRYGRFEKRQYKSDNITSNDVVKELSDINGIYLQNVYLLSSVEGGGSYKFILDLASNFKHIRFRQILHKKGLMSVNFIESDIVIIQHLFFTKIDFYDIKIIKSKVLKIIICVHDWYWLQEDKIDNFKCKEDSIFSEYLNKNLLISEDIIKIFDFVDLVICPSLFIYEGYSKYFNLNKFIISEPIDYKIKDDLYIVPIINNLTINIGMLCDNTLVKGSEIVRILKNKYVNYNGYEISFKIVNDTIDKYKEDEFMECIEKNNINGLIYLNKYGESYSYALTKYLNSGLPIIYNNFGSFRVRIKESSHYFKMFEFENEYKDELINPNISYIKFEEFLDYIILNNKDKYIFNETILNIPLFYENLFSKIYFDKNLVIIQGNTNENTIKAIRNNIANSYIILLAPNKTHNVDLYIMYSEFEFIKYLKDILFYKININLFNMIFIVNSDDVIDENYMKYSIEKDVFIQ